MILLEQHNRRHKRFCSFGRIRKMRFPVVETATLYSHDVAQQLYRKHTRQFQDYLVLLLSKGANSF